jgi:hypothetical protein
MFFTAKVRFNQGQFHTALPIACSIKVKMSEDVEDIHTWVNEDRFHICIPNAVICQGRIFIYPNGRSLQPSKGGYFWARHSALHPACPDYGNDFFVSRALALPISKGKCVSQL